MCLSAALCVQELLNTLGSSQVCVHLHLSSFLHQTERVYLCSGVGWLVPWLPPVATTQCECLRRKRRAIRTSRCSRWLLRWPKLTTRMSTVSPGARRRQDSWPPAVMMETSPSGDSKRKTESLLTSLACHWTRSYCKLHWKLVTTHDVVHLAFKDHLIALGFSLILVYKHITSFPSVSRL